MPSPSDFNADLTARFARWLKVRQYAAATNRFYLGSIVSLCEFLDDVPATDVTHLDVRDFLARIARQGLKPATIWRAMCALRCFFDFLNMGGLINWSPPRFVRLSRIKRAVPRVLTESQIKLLLSSARDLHERTMLEVLYGTGARAGEIRNMRVEDVDLVARRIRVLGKSGFRFVLFPKTTSRYLRRYIGQRKAGYLFVVRAIPSKLHLIRNPNGSWRSYFYKYNTLTKHTERLYWYAPKCEGLTYDRALARFIRHKKRILRSGQSQPIGEQPLGTTTVRYVVMRVGLRAGLRVSPQLLRHTFATHLLDHGADIVSIQRMLGHSSVRTTQGYTRISMKQVQAVLERCHPRNQ